MAAREFAQTCGKQIHAVQHLRVGTGVLSLVIQILGIAPVRRAWAPQPKPLVVRADVMGDAEALGYEAMDTQACWVVSERPRLLGAGSVCHQPSGDALRVHAETDAAPSRSG